MSNLISAGADLSRLLEFFKFEDYFQIENSNKECLNEVYSKIRAMDGSHEDTKYQTVSFKGSADDINTYKIDSYFGYLHAFEVNVSESEYVILLAGLTGNEYNTILKIAKEYHLVVPDWVE